MDVTYRSELKELNELNFARFDAKVEQRVAELRAELRQEIAGLRAEMHAGFASQIKWMFGLLGSDYAHADRDNRRSGKASRQLKGIGGGPPLPLPVAPHTPVPDLRRYRDTM